MVLPALYTSACLLMFDFQQRPRTRLLECLLAFIVFWVCIGRDRDSRSGRSIQVLLFTEAERDQAKAHPAELVGAYALIKESLLHMFTRTI